jgi:hypothetical protein
MWIEAIVTQEDLRAVLDQLLPMKIHLDKDESKERWLHLDRATDIELLADKGLRVACPAEIMWSVSVVNIPIKLHTLRVVLKPEIVRKHHGDVLSFHIQLEEADIAGLPALVDHTIMHAVNEALAGKDLAWDFTKTLSRTVPFPGVLDPIDGLAIRVHWGKCRIGAEAIALVVSFDLAFHRGD